MASNIDTTQPPEGNATTAAMRANMAAAKQEIEALQSPPIIMLGITSDKTITHGSVVTYMPWDAIVNNNPQAGVWTIGDPTTLHIPAGISRIRLSGQLRVTNWDGATILNAHIYKNGALNYDGIAVDPFIITNTNVAQAKIQSPWLDVIEGDYFKIGLVNVDPSLDMIIGTSPRVWLQAEFQ